MTITPLMNTKKIYIVDDQAELLSLYKEALEDNIDDIEVDIFTDGSNCLNNIEEGNIPHLVITDLKMPTVNGHQLAKKVLELNPNIPLILNTGYGKNIPISSGIKVGYRDIIDKHCPIDAFIQSVKKNLNDVGIGTVNDYLKIDGETIRSFEKAPFAIHVRLNDGKFVNLINQDDPIPKQKLIEYERRGVTNFYVELEKFQGCHELVYLSFRIKVLQVGQKVDFNIYVNLNKNIKRLIPAGTEIRSEHLALLKKHSIKELLYDHDQEEEYLLYLDSVIDSILQEENSDDLLSAEILRSYAAGKTGKKNNLIKMDEIIRMVQLIEAFVAKNKKSNLCKVAQLFNDNSSQHHCIRVSFLCMGVINKILYLRQSKDGKRLVSSFENSIHDGKEMRNMVITAAMVHDLGSGEQYARVESTVEYLEKRSEIIPKVVEIVLQHRELLDGSGGPNKLVKRQMTAYSQLLSLVNYYDELVSEGNSWKDAIIDIQMNESQYNQHLAKILKMILED